MSPDIQALTDEVTRAKTVMQSAEVAINGIATRIQAGVDAALASGATAEQIKPLADLGTALNAESDALQAAVVANTAAAIAPLGAKTPAAASVFSDHPEAGKPAPAQADGAS